MTNPTTVDVADVIDARGLGPFQIGVFFLFGLFLVMDGFDVQAMGYVAPAVIEDFGIENSAITPAFTWGLIGLFIGAIVFGMAGDRLGRRRVLLASTVAFSFFTFLSARANSVDQLVIIRFFAGLGLGAILPNATALIGEFSPRRMKIAMMMIVTNGFTIGAMLGGFLAAWLIPNFGWRSVFYVGAAVPLILLVPMYVWLPESLQFLALRRNDSAEIAKWLKRIDPAAAVDGNTQFTVGETKARGFPIWRLLTNGRAGGTLLLWAANFLNVMNAYFVSSWLPTIVRDSGYATGTAVLVGATVQTGGVIGTLIIAGILPRIGFIPVLTACFATACISLFFLGEPALGLAAIFFIAFFTGWGIFGGQPALNALSATFYPTDLRSTGIGAGLGVGRFGAVFGPLIAGSLMAREWTNESLFHVFALPALGATLAVLLMTRAMSSEVRSGLSAATT
jgi:AAHS family 4-hydroxybenzoate transporter-like MFS transporter